MCCCVWSEGTARGSAFHYFHAANSGVLPPVLLLLLLLLQKYSSLVMNATGWDGWVAANLPAAK
jgi:hypothetical protein